MQAIKQLYLCGDHFYSVNGGLGFALEPQPECIRAIFSRRAELQMRLRAASNLTSQNASLFCIINGDGETQTGYLFAWKGTRVITLANGRSPWAEYYEPKWWSEIQYDAQGETDFGFLITGSTETSVWRIVSAEADHLQIAKLRLRLLMPPTALPAMDFSRVSNPELRKGIESAWAKLSEHVAQKRGEEVVTASKNVLEGLLADALERAGHPSGGVLAEKLSRIEKLPAAARASVLGPLEFHSAQKIRLLHQRTHPERAAKLARQMRPEYLLSSVEDLVEFLTSLGYARTGS
ncbi:MAG: hypothetical protein ACRD5K_07615 [Candidatus Acidiferrales bacterium]